MKKQQKGILRVGTSNIILPGNKQSFPEAFQHKSRLNYYSSRFNTVEVNSSFYKVPMPFTFEKWSMDVPENFQFTLKLFREITHVKELSADLDKINHFIKSANRIGKKKGCILVQFPGKITLKYFSRVEVILQRLAETDQSSQWKKAIEFRSPDWYTGETAELLSDYSASMVLHDIPTAKIFEAGKGGGFVYVRFHGPKGDYRGGYPTVFLQEKAGQIKRWLKEGRDVYAYFNNTIGSAFENAITLQTLIEK